MKEDSVLLLHRIYQWGKTFEIKILKWSMLFHETLIELLHTEIFFFLNIMLDSLICFKMKRTSTQIPESVYVSV